MATIEQVIDKYVEIRDKLDEERKKFQLLEADLKGKIARLEMFLREKADEQGVDGFRTSAGTAYRKTKESFRCGSWPEILEFIQRTGNWGMLEKRIAKLATKEIWDDLVAKGDVIPGIDYVAEVVFEVRRPTKKEK